MCERAVRDLRLERFGAQAGVVAEAATGDTFQVELRRSGTVIRVGSNERMLDRIKEVCPDLRTSCEEGFCGTCETAVLEGVPEHNDTILNERERMAGKTMMVCVGRSKSPRLVLDL